MSVKWNWMIVRAGAASHVFSFRFVAALAAALAVMPDVR